MLSDQESPYVGRFACDWHRLPGSFPGQPQTQTRARSSISVRNCAGNSSGGDEQADLLRTIVTEDPRTRRGGRAGRKHVVNEQHALGRSPAGRAEDALHREAPVDPASTRLGAGRVVAAEKRLYRAVEVDADDQRECPGLVVATLREPEPGERDPRDRVRPKHVDGGHRVSEGVRHFPPPGELQPVDRGAYGTTEQERCAGDRDRRGRAVEAVAEGLVARTSAPPAHRFVDRRQGLGTHRAERPVSCSAPGAPWREEQIQHRTEHLRTLARATDSADELLQGSGISTMASFDRDRSFTAPTSTRSVE
jgi:hypothetical protein